MIHRCVYSILFRLLIVAVCLTAATPHADAVERWKRQVDRLFAEWDRPTKPGCALAIVRDGNVIYERGYGMASLRYDVPIEPSTIFRCASTSKQFTVFSILLLEEEGRLSLDDDVRKYVTEVPDFGETITIRHMIYHISGLRDHFVLMAYAGWNFFEDLLTTDHVLEIVQGQKELNFPVGDQTMYSNTGFALLAEIVSRVSGMTFPEFTQERIFTPLGMSSSYFGDDNRRIVKELADSYLPLEAAGYEFAPMNFVGVGEAGLHSTVADLVKWDLNFNDPVVGSHSLLETMHQTDFHNDGSPTPFAMGLIVFEDAGHTVVMHGGDLSGYHSQIVQLPDDGLTIIALSNTMELSSSDLAEKSFQIAEILLSGQATPVRDYQRHAPSFAAWGTNFSFPFAPDLDVATLLSHPQKPSLTDRIDKSVWRTLASITPAEAEEYLGRYYSEELDVFHTVVFDDEGFLLFQVPRARTIYVLGVPELRDDEFYFGPEDIGIGGRFFRNAAGEVVGFEIDNPRVVGLKFHRAEIVTSE